MSLPLLHTFTAIVAGPSRSGKTTWVKQLLDNLHIITPMPERVIFCYSEWQTAYDSINNAEFQQGIIDIEKLGAQRVLLIVDDLMSECEDTVEKVCTKYSHHKNISLIYITQNLFHRHKRMRTISLNASYLVLFKNPRDIHQISYLSRQMYPAKQGVFLEEAFQDATRFPFGYLFIDLRQDTNELSRVRTGIFPDEQQYIYIPKHLVASLPRASLN